MNANTWEIYVTQQQIDDAKARGAEVIELSDGICSQLYSIEKAQEMLDWKKRLKQSFMLPQVPYSSRY